MKIKKSNKELFATKTNLKMENLKQKFLFFRSIQPQYLLQGQNWHLQKNYKKWEKYTEVKKNVKKNCKINWKQIKKNSNINWKIN